MAKQSDDLVKRQWLGIELVTFERHCVINIFKNGNIVDKSFQLDKVITFDEALAYVQVMNRLEERIIVTTTPGENR